MTGDFLEPPRVLIVDDDQKIVDLLVDLLNAAAYQTITAPDGANALQQVHSFDPDIVISDVVMPGINGVELCRRLKTDLRTRNIPVLLISGMRRSDCDDLEGLNAGADDYLELPFRNEELLVKVAKLTERHRIEKHYRQIVEQAADIIYTRNVSGYITSMNEAGIRFFGRSQAEIIGVHLSELLGAEAAAVYIEQTNSIESDSSLRSIHHLQDHQGNWRYLEAVITVERDRRGQVSEIRGVVRDITDEKLAEDALRESEERYRRLVNLSPEAIVVHTNGDIVFINPAAQKLWRASSPEELLGQRILDLVHPDYRVLVSKRLIRVQQEGLSAELSEQKYIALDGEIIDVEETEIPFTYSGQPAVQSVIRDVTENRKAEKALAENEERFRDLFENANDIIYTHDLQGNFTSLNRSGERITGYSRDEAALMNITDVLAPDYVNLARRMMALKTARKLPTVYELEMITKDGRRVRLEVSTQLIFRAGNAVGVQGIGRDLTERKRSEEALRETQSFFHSFMDNSPAVAFMKDQDGRYLYVNKPFEQFFDQKLTFLRGRTSFDWLPEDIARLSHESDLQVASSGTPQEIVETLPTRDGKSHHWLVFKFPITDAAGKTFVGGVGVDITERRDAEKALAEQAEREALTHLISQSIRCSLDSTEIFRTAVHQLGLHLNVDRCSLFMKDQRAKRVLNVAEYHVPQVQPAAADFELAEIKGLIDSLDKNGVLSFTDAAHDERIADVYKRILAKADVRSIMYVAIKVGDEIPAAFALSTTRELRSWSESDIALAKAVANQTGIAIRQAALYQRAENTSAREALVNRLAMVIRASLSLSEVLRATTRELGIALAASRVHIHLHNSEDPLSPVEHEYVAPGCTRASHTPVSYDHPIGRQLMTAARPVVADDALNYSFGAADFEQSIRSHARKLNLRSQIEYPLIVKGIFRGVLCIHQTDRVRYWTEDEMALIEAVTARLAIGIAQAELFEMVVRGKSEWETTFDAMSDGIFIFDRTGTLMRVNRAGAALENEHPRTLLGRACCEILRTSAEERECAVERAMARGRSITVEITPEHLNRPLLVTIEPVFDSGNKAMAVVCTARDLSELRKVQAVAREHQSLLTNILESARESIYALDLAGRFKWCNGATLAGLGVKREDFIGRHLLDMVYEPDRPLVNEKLHAVLKGNPQTYEMRYFAGNGRLRYAVVDNSPLVVEGNTTGVLGIARDITVQKEERERAARADKLRALGQLASGVAHDFNNSLAAILGRTQLLQRQTEDAAALHNLEIIQTAAEDAAATVRRIQTFASKAPVKEFEILDIRGMLHDAIEITRTRWENEARLSGLEYQVTLQAEGGQYAYGSASELREVFVNLIVNSVDAMPQGGELTISCTTKASQLQLQFADTGVGMSEDVCQKIFEPFFTTKGAQGTGLGLSVSYSIIERHEGAISVHSTTGVGTVFTIDLPAAQISRVQVVNSGPFPKVPALSILVIDDEQTVRETLADMLGMMQHRVIVAAGGVEALQELDQANFDLVFSDLAMPEMDGWETARRIRKRCSSIKIVLVTGYGPGTVRPPGEEDLVDGIIGKPFDFRQVSEILAAVMGSKNELEKVNA